MPLWPPKCARWRSAAASKEIEGLIADTVSRVSDGRLAAGSASATMDEVLRGVGGVNELIGQIALAPEEQSKEIAQVTLAVTEPDRVTQQNATLVQQVTATAGSLNGQTTRCHPLYAAVSGRWPPHGRAAGPPASDESSGGRVT